MGHNEGVGFGEIRYSLRLLEANAPWFNKAYILANGDARPAWLTEESKDKIVMIDRCKLFDRPQDCPTENTDACESVTHRVPGLSEHYVYMQDDFLVMNPAEPSAFFSSDGKPLVFPLKPDVDFAIYGSDPPPGPDMPPTNQPRRCDEIRHLPIPLLASFAKKMEQTYPEWFAFVRSHHKRFSCCDINSRNDPMQESFIRVWPHMLLQHSVGIHHPIEAKASCIDQSDSTDWYHDCMQEHLTSKTLQFVTLQNVAYTTTWQQVENLLKDHLQDMPQSRFIRTENMVASIMENGRTLTQMKACDLELLCGEKACEISCRT